MTLATGYGEISDLAWLDCYRELAEKRIMPRKLFEQVEAKILASRP